MKLSGWGRYPCARGRIFAPRDRAELAARLKSAARHPWTIIPRGLGRSYGDSALAPETISLRQWDYLASFDTVGGRLRCGAGATLDALLRRTVPAGWFLPVTPGTRYVTVGGAIASDVHGKNHPAAGCFSRHVIEIKLMLADGDVVACSPRQHPDLFRATCAGMGLTGVILEATLALMPIGSAYLEAEERCTADLHETIEALTGTRPYEVAWVDAMAKGRWRGRGRVTTAGHQDRGPLHVHGGASLAVPAAFPGTLVNAYTARLFNQAYYRRCAERRSLVHYDRFFYPLDRLGHWHRLYGRRGMVQHQCVLPGESAAAGLAALLQAVERSGQACPLAVLKRLGPANDNHLSFPRSGLTLAMDFKANDQALKLLDRLDDLVLEFGGRVYLTKDGRMSEATFKRSYPQWEKVAEIRARYGADRVFNSLQSLRLGF